MRLYNFIKFSGIEFIELIGIKCYVCKLGGNCCEDIYERKCFKELLLMDKCMLMMDNGNE